MAAVFEQSTPADADAILNLMLEVYEAPRDIYFNSHALFHWKYFAPGPAWPGSRGYVMRTGNGEIVSHLGVCPTAFHSQNGCITGAALMDWVSTARAPGLGAVLLRKVLAKTDVAFVAGGSELARRTIGRFGFTQAGKVELFAKVVRPWRQFRSRSPSPSLRDVARLARNAAWRVRFPVRNYWSARRVPEFAAGNEIILDSFRAPVHTPAFLNYWLQNPAVSVSGFALERGSQARGYFVLSRVAHQTRIVDLRTTGGEADWAGAISTASHAAAAEPDTFEIVAATSAPIVRRALLRCGFRPRRTIPLFVYDPRERLRGGLPGWSLIDDDSGYIRYPGYPYET